MPSDVLVAWEQRQNPSRQEPVLELVEVTKRFVVHGHRGEAVRQRQITAVDCVSLGLRPGEITALVGESGSGKSTVARILSQLERPSSGSVRLHGRKVRFGVLSGRRAYLRQVQLIFQDPFASLNPAHTVRYHLERPLKVHGYARTRQEVHGALEMLLEEVQLTPPARFLDCFPYQLSGGQRQRVAIARALAVQPEVLLADEPVSMLDVSIRLGVLNLLAQLAEDRNLALLYITHDIASARYFATTTHVMYAGGVVECGPSEDVIRSPRHPYTQLLLDSSPDPMRGPAPTPLGERWGVEGVPVHGCRFRPRCPFAMEQCARESPPPVQVGAEHWSRCFLLESRTSSRT